MFSVDLFKNRVQNLWKTLTAKTTKTERDRNHILHFKKSDISLVNFVVIWRPFLMGWGIVFPFSSIFTTGEKIFHFRFNANISVAIRPFPQHVRSPSNSYVPLLSCSLLQDRCPFIREFYIL